jgi:hypothetical protein
MANPTTPYGFQEVGLIDGVDPTFGMYTGQIAVTNTHTIYANDPAVFAAGYFDVASVTGNTGAGVAGVFVEFSYLSIAMGQRVRNRAWMGNTADIVSGSVITCKVNIHPQAKFKVRATGASNNPITQAMVGNLINFALGAGPGNNLVSTFSADAATETGTSTTLPFKILDLVQQPETDPTLINNEIIVGFNPASFLQL